MLTKETVRDALIRTGADIDEEIDSVIRAGVMINYLAENDIVVFNLWREARENKLRDHISFLDTVRSSLHDKELDEFNNNLSNLDDIDHFFIMSLYPINYINNCNETSLSDKEIRSFYNDRSISKWIGVK